MTISVTFGEKVLEGRIISMILSSLPKAYDILMTALEIRPEKDLILDIVKSKLIEEYKRQKGKT